NVHKCWRLRWDVFNFAWNVGAGLRYEIQRGMYVRGGWEQTHIDGGSGTDPTFDAFRLELGWMF
ncbi:MAG: outer membrane beta-barrel protein, partial [Pseudomonadota bacterium]